MRTPDPDDLRSVIDRTAANMLASGWALTAVLGDPGFTYTTGFTPTLGVPEVVVVGLPPETAGPILNDLGRLLRAMPVEARLRQLADGATMSGLVRGLTVGFRARGTFAECGQLLLTAEVLGREDFAVTQLLWPDKANRLPTDPACNPRMAAMQVWPPEAP